MEWILFVMISMIWDTYCDKYGVCKSILKFTILTKLNTSTLADFTIINTSNACVILRDTQIYDSDTSGVLNNSSL